MSLGSWLSGAARDVGRVSGRAVRTVGRGAESVAKAAVHNPVTRLAEDAVREASKLTRLPQAALGLVTRTPVFQLVAQGVSYIPGIGQVVGAGMGALAAIGQGASMADIGLRAARGALPGQPASTAAFDIAVGILLKGQKLDATALKLARDRVPGGAYGKAAFDTAVNLIVGRSHNLADAALATARKAIPSHPAAQAAFDLGAGLARGKGVPPQMIQAVRQRVPGGALGQAVFDTAVLSARPGQLSKDVLSVYAKRLAPLGAAGKALGKAVGQAAKVNGERMRVFQALAALRTAGAFVRKLELHDGATKRQFTALGREAERGNPRAQALMKLLTIARKAWATHPHLMQGATTAKGAVAGAWPPERVIHAANRARPQPSAAAATPQPAQAATPQPAQGPLGTSQVSPSPMHAPFGPNATPGQTPIAPNATPAQAPFGSGYVAHVPYPAGAPYPYPAATAYAVTYNIPPFTPQGPHAAGAPFGTGPISVSTPRQAASSFSPFPTAGSAAPSTSSSPPPIPGGRATRSRRARDRNGGLGVHRRSHWQVGRLLPSTLSHQHRGPLDPRCVFDGSRRHRSLD